MRLGGFNMYPRGDEIQEDDRNCVREAGVTPYHNGFSFCAVAITRVLFRSKITHTVYNITKVTVS